MLKTVGVDKDIAITDEVRFVLQTTDGKDCLVRPYQITSATLYFISREFTDTTASEYTLETEKGDLLAEYEALKAEACLKALENVRAATDSNITLSGEQTVDGISVEEGDRVLVRKQTDKTQNGIYVVSSGAWSRSSDADTNDKFVAGMYVLVEEGISNVNSGWYLSKSGSTVLGTSPILFLNFPASDPSPDMNLVQRLATLKVQLDESKTSSPFFYKEAVPVKVFGGVTDPNTQEFFPAWLNPDMVPSEIVENVIADNMLSEYEENGQAVKGKFTLD
jgi:phage-related tail fiber protein